VLNRKLPLWYQVAQSLRSEILGRAASEPYRLATEAELSKQYGVSLITLRQALKSIEEEGLISRHRRRGTFVNPQASPRRPLQLLGSIESVFAQQSADQTIVLEKRDRVSVPPHLKPTFADEAEVTFFRRLRFDQGEPVSYAQNWVRPEFGDRIQATQLEQAGMTRVLREELGVRIPRIENTVEAQLATPEVASLLKMDMLAPLLLFTGISYDARGRAIDVASICYRGDRYKFSVGLNLLE
jgi:GntR family transcriptional regulator